MEAAAGLVLAGCLQVPPDSAEGGGFRRALVIAPGSVAAPLAEFPVLVRLSGDAGLSAHGTDDGLDVVFRDGAGTILPFERASWDRAAGDLAAWVNVPLVSAEEATVLYLHYGGAGGSDQSEPPAVWRGGFAAVWHFEEEPGATLDSTAAGNHALGTAGSVALGPGFVGNAVEFAGSEDYIDFGSDLPPEVDAGQLLTVTAWVRYDALNEWGHFLAKAPLGDNSQGWGLGIDVDFDFMIRVMDGDQNARGWTDAAEPLAGTWHHWAMIYDGTQSVDTARLRGMRDGEEYGLAYSAPIPARFDSQGGPLYLGCATWNTPTYCIDGAVDEVRIAGDARSTAWVAAEFASQVAGSTFVGVGEEESLE
ncbi:MAG TPA: DUF2341 domain-containing protein [Kofleriaceae bacterium]